jgi:hypothetical protein
MVPVSPPPLPPRPALHLCPSVAYPSPLPITLSSGDALLCSLSTRTILQVLWLLLVHSPGAVRAAFQGLSPSTLDLLARRWDDLDAVGSVAPRPVAEPTPAPHPTDPATPTAPAAPAGPSPSPGPAAPLGGTSLLFCEGCVAALGPVPGDGDGSSSGGRVALPPIPDLFGAFYEEVDSTAAMDSVRVALRPRLSPQPLLTPPSSSFTALWVFLTCWFAYSLASCIGLCVFSVTAA